MPNVTRINGFVQIFAILYYRTHISSEFEDRRKIIAQGTLNKDDATSQAA